jgi:hypothetical protein
VKQYIGISRDHSASMRSLKVPARDDYNQNIEAIRKAAESENIDTIVSVVECGVGNGRVERAVVNSSVAKLNALANYTTEGTATPLFDSVGELIELLESVPDATQPDVSFLVMAITDGEENASKKYVRTLGDKIRQLQATDRWTFVFRVPKGYARHLTTLGIPSGNIVEWEQTERGMRESSIHNQQAVSRYFTGLRAGVRSTDQFYTNLANLSARDVKAALKDISAQVDIWPVKRPSEIRNFVEYKLGNRPMRIGAAFYQLSKKEKVVQDYKLIVVRDKTTGAVYFGQASRDLLGLPTSGTIQLSPGDHGNYEVYVQSASVNRKLVPGTNVLYWDQVTVSVPKTW